jgi:hypothetical protein
MRTTIPDRVVGGSTSPAYGENRARQSLNSLIGINQESRTWRRRSPWDLDSINAKSASSVGRLSGTTKGRIGQFGNERRVIEMEAHPSRKARVRISTVVALVDIATNWVRCSTLSLSYRPTSTRRSATLRYT